MLPVGSLHVAEMGIKLRFLLSDQIVPPSPPCPCRRHQLKCPLAPQGPRCIPGHLAPDMPQVQRHTADPEGLVKQPRGMAAIPGNPPAVFRVGRGWLSSLGPGQRSPAGGRGDRLPHRPQAGGGPWTRSGQCPRASPRTAPVASGRLSGSALVFRVGFCTSIPSLLLAGPSPWFSQSSSAPSTRHPLGRQPHPAWASGPPETPCASGSPTRLHMALIKCASSRRGFLFCLQLEALTTQVTATAHYKGHFLAQWGWGQGLGVAVLFQHLRDSFWWSKKFLPGPLRPGEKPA